MRRSRLGVVMVGSLAIAAAGAYGVIGGARSQAEVVISAIGLIYGLAAAGVSGAMLLTAALGAVRAC